MCTARKASTWPFLLAHSALRTSTLYLPRPFLSSLPLRIAVMTSLHNLPRKTTRASAQTEQIRQKSLRREKTNSGEKKNCAPPHALKRRGVVTVRIVDEEKNKESVRVQTR